MSRPSPRDNLKGTLARGNRGLLTCDEALVPPFGSITLPSSAILTANQRRRCTMSTIYNLTDGIPWNVAPYGLERRIVWGSYAAHSGSLPTGV
ncbi:unnamed protein product [Heterotrigona itama]|uniref:Uncharacterized protein n=1 Tax=Heterotrigona itama TaxID=395501 RepID=A0A6V7HK79_9HYME|nr:unnamed protein product [Heterotrigona itama]